MASDVMRVRLHLRQVRVLTVVTMDAERRVIPDGAVAIAGDRIAGVGGGPSCGPATPTPAAWTGPDAT